MKNPWFSLLAVSLLAALVSFAVFRQMARKEPLRLDALQETEWLSKTLHLEPSQVKAISEMQPELGRKLSDCCGRHCRARGQLFNALLASTNGIEDARALVDEMCRAQADSEMATLEHIRRIYQVLNPEQRKEYARQLGGMTCTDCTVCEGQPGEGLQHAKR